MVISISSPGDGSPGAVTHLLLRWRGGEPAALDELVPIVYAELRQAAASQLRRELGPRTLQPTALVHEAYLRLVDAPAIDWQSRAHFLAVASKVMRRILVERARARLAEKRGGPDVEMVTLDAAEAAVAARPVDLVALDRALERLARLDPEQATIIDLRFFGGLSIEETAEVLASSPATVKRRFGSARAWLFRELGGVAGAPGG